MSVRLWKMGHVFALRDCKSVESIRICVHPYFSQMNWIYIEVPTIFLKERVSGRKPHDPDTEKKLSVGHLVF